jgi:hypothetical protein
VRIPLAGRALFACAVALAASACGSGTSATAGHGTTGTTGTAAEAPLPAGATPSKVSRIVCGAEAEGEIDYALGEKPIDPIRPTWVDHVYSCRYVYAKGVMVLSVKEVSSYGQTVAYFDGLGRTLGDTGRLNGLGQGAFSTTDGSVVVRKDYKILLVDVSGLPAEFGHPATSAGDVAITVADVILACWAGD